MADLLVTGVEVPAIVLDRIARLIEPGIYGVSSGGGKTVIHNVGANTGLLSGAMTAFDSLLPLVAPGSIPDDGVTEASITLNIADANLDYLIVDSNGAIVGEGTEATVAGVLTLEFSSAVAGVFDIWVLRKTGDYACGHVRVTVTEV